MDAIKNAAIVSLLWRKLLADGSCRNSFVAKAAQSKY